MSVASQMGSTQMAKRLSIGKRRLLNLKRHGVLSSLSFTDNNGARYFDQARLGKATNIFQKKQGNANQSSKGPAVAGPFLLMLSQKIIV